MRKGLTLIELLIATVMIAILTSVSAFVFRAILLSWSGQESRAGIDIGLDRGIEEMAQDLREAKQVAQGNDEIRFSLDNSTFYIYYLYNSTVTYPLSFADSTLLYQLKKASIASLNADFTASYGSGNIIITDIVSPATSDLSYASNIVNIDLSIKRKGETIRSKTQVRPRNL